MKTYQKVLGHLWMCLNTLVGLLVVLVGWSKWHRFEKGDWSLHFVAKPGGLLSWWFKKYRFVGITIGGVIIFDSVETANTADYIKHERVHVKQGMKLGPFDPVLYYLSCLIAWVTGQDKYRGSDFEEQARFESGQVKMPKDIAPRK